METNVAIICIAKIFQESLHYIYNDENIDLQIIIDQIEALRSNPQQIRKIEGYVEFVIPLLNSMQFQSHFRMLPSTFEFILRKIGKKLIRSIERNEMIPAEKQLLLSLWRFATPDSYRSIIQRFNVGHATAIRAVRRVSAALCKLSSQYIVWPTGNNIEEIVFGFSSISNFPNTIGAIDGTHINIPAPKENAEAYVNRKGRHSIQLQAVCNHRRLFTHIYVGNVGSVHDARLFRLSPIEEYINNAGKFPDNTHLIGDAAYRLHQHLLTPYTDNGHLTQRPKNYNYCHSSSRMVIERAFALLKCRWRSLLQLLAMNDIEIIPYHILACCVLHNFCLLKKDGLEFQDGIIVEEVQETELLQRFELEMDYCCPV
nr:PREDICTED: LOW QUALITY PROTEIN: putative nuclease HARBI1 [Linepithema humile]